MSAASNVSAASSRWSCTHAAAQAREVRRLDRRQDLRGGQRLPTIGQGIDGLAAQRPGRRGGVASGTQTGFSSATVITTGPSTSSSPSRSPTAVGTSATT